MWEISSQTRGIEPTPSAVKVQSPNHWTAREFPSSLFFNNNLKNYVFWDFLGSAVVENPPANAGDTGLSPGLGRSHMPRSNWAHVPQLLSLRSRASEPQLLSPHAATTAAHVPRAHALHQREATAMGSPRTTTKSSPRSQQLGKAHTKTQRSQKINKQINLF